MNFQMYCRPYKKSKFFLLKKTLLVITFRTEFIVKPSSQTRSVDQIKTPNATPLFEF